MRLSLARVLSLTAALACAASSAVAQRASLFDELTVLYPDSQPSTGRTTYAGNTPRGVIAGVHVLVAGLPPGARLSWTLRQGAAPVADARVFRLIDVPVEQNTGLGSRTEAFEKKINPYVIRRAPFRVFEVLEPAGAAVVASARGVVALRVEVPIAADAPPGTRTYRLVLTSGDWHQELTWKLTVYPVAVPPRGPQSPGFTNWFNLGNIASRHGLKPWSKEYWEMLGRYADVMARARQNTFWVPLGSFAHKNAAGKLVLDRKRLRRYVRLFLRRGFTRVEGGHLAGRHKGDWNSPRLDFNFTGHDVTTEPGRTEVAEFLDTLRGVLDELDLPPGVEYLQHLTDEPTDTNAAAYRALAGLVRRHLPGVRIFEATMSQKLVGAVDDWCPQIQEYQKHRDFFDARKRAGDRVWVYTCLAPGGPWLNRLLDQERLRPVYIGWALAKYDLAGFLHWGLNFYRKGVDPLQQSVVPHGAGAPNFLPAGDSHIVYPGKHGPLSSQRFEAHRIGMEDAELLRLLARRSPARAAAIINRVLRACDDYTKDVAAYRAARTELLEALSAPTAAASAPASQAASAPTTAPAVLRCTFDQPDDARRFEAFAEGENVKRKSPPRIYDHKLYLLESWQKSVASVAFPAPADTHRRVIDVTFTLIMNTGTEGAGFAWLDTGRFGRAGKAPKVDKWEEPSIPGSLGVGFDALDPPNRDPFRGSGNVYDRPQHELSLHYDGREIVKRTTPMDFRDETPHPVRVRIEFVVGGANVSVWIDDIPIYDGYFIPAMTAYVGRPAFGARNAETAGDVLIDDLTVRCAELIDPPEPPTTVVAIDHELNDAKHPVHETEVAFPQDTDRFGRIICTLRLDKPETRFDPWDRIARVWIFDDDGRRYELLRYITPYHRGFVWKVDVSDFRPLLRGKRRIQQVCHTQGEGWVVTVRFDFYPGPADRLAYRVVNLWSGAPEIGNPDKPVSDFYVPRTIKLDPQTSAAKVRVVVTGHGMSPNTDNAGEFMPLGRTLRINGHARRNILWKTDNYLNPCRPQGGTWKYDRAGWAPGDVVRPWEIDATPYIGPDRTLRIEYELDTYINKNRGKTWAPTHVTEAQLILYRDARKR